MPQPAAIRVVIVTTVLALLAAGMPAQAQVASQPLDEIRAVAVMALGAADAQSAEAVLDPALRLSRCSQPLQAVATGPATAQVRCDDAPGWRIYVPVRVRREATVVTLRAPAAAGVPITAEQLVVQRREVGGMAGATFSDPAALVGRIPGRAMAPGVVPTAADLSSGAALRRGDPVVLVARSGGVEVRMAGRALGAAQAGGAVAVENTASRRVLRGRLVGEGVVELLP